MEAATDKLPLHLRLRLGRRQVFLGPDHHARREDGARDHAKALLGGEPLLDRLRGHYVPRGAFTRRERWATRLGQGDFAGCFACIDVVEHRLVLRQGTPSLVCFTIR